MSRPFLPEGVGLEKNTRIRFTMADFAFLDKFARKRGLTFSQMVRIALREYVGRNIKTKKMGFQDDIMG